MFATSTMIKHKVYGNLYIPDQCAGIRPIVCDGQSIWESHIISQIEKYLKPGTIAIDCGAYVGLHSMIMASRAKKVFAIEMMPEHYKCLLDNVRANDHQNIITIHCALGNESKELVEIPDVNYSIAQNYGGASLVARIRERVPAKRLLIAMRNLDRICSSFLEGEKVSLIKIDVEGMEVDVLNGSRYMINKYRPVILIEIWRECLPAFYASDVYKYMKQINYEFQEGPGTDHVLIPTN